MAEQQNKTVLTEEGLKKLEAQLDYLVSVRRNEVSEQIAIARGFGDLSENAEYDEAKKEQAKVEEEIVRLTNTIRTAVVVADSEISTEKVSVGTLSLIHISPSLLMVCSFSALVRGSIKSVFL